MTKKEIYKVLKKTRGDAFISWLTDQDINYRDVDYVSVEHKHWGSVITFTTLDDPDWFRTIKDIGGI